MLGLVGAILLPVHSNVTTVNYHTFIHTDVLIAFTRGFRLDVSLPKRVNNNLGTIAVSLLETKGVGRCFEWNANGVQERSTTH